LVREDVVRLELDAVTHRFTAGNRIRLLIAGGSFPRWSATLAPGERTLPNPRDGASRRTMDPSAASNARLTVGRSIVSESGTTGRFFDCPNGPEQA
jgi:predicted acyl esterase